jgi:Spy/CpxP family protein refolding chaperone
MQHKELMMKFRTKLSITAAGLLLAGTALAQSHGMGPNMMGGYGMGQGSMRGSPNGALASLKLSADQQKKIADIRSTSSKAMWQLMGTMHEQDGHMQGMYGPGSVDEAGARKSFQTMTETRQAMFDLQLDTRKKIDSVLTKEQREQLAQ